MQKHIIVRGHVQMVGFRYFTVRKAREMGLVGFVQNLLSGEVEILAEGPPKILNDFIDEISKGPSGASVSEVLVSDDIKSEGNYTDFIVK